MTYDLSHGAPIYPQTDGLLQQSLFEDCRELAPAFQQMLRRPSKLRLVLNEAYPGGQRPATGDAGPAPGAPLYEVGTMVHTTYGIQEYFFVRLPSDICS